MGENEKETRALSPVEKRVSLLMQELTKRKPELEALLPKFMTSERLLRLFVDSIRKNPKIAECTMASIYNAVMDWARTGLEVGGAMAEACLIPYEDRADGRGLELRFQPMYGGLIKLAKEEGPVTALSCEVVRANDLFEARKGLEPKLDHVPFEFRHDADKPAGDDPGPVVAAYAVLWQRDAPAQIEIMSNRDLSKIEAASKARSSKSPWRGEFRDQMERKSVLKRALKYVQKTPALAAAIEIDNRIEGAIDTDFDLLLNGNAEEKLKAGKHDLRKKKKGAATAEEIPGTTGASNVTAPALPPDPNPPDLQDPLANVQARDPKIPGCEVCKTNQYVEMGAKPFTWLCKKCGTVFEDN